MSYSPSQNLYGIGIGSGPNSAQIVEPRDPTSSDVNYKILQKWLNSSAGTLWSLTNLSASNGVITANWSAITGGTIFDQATTDSGTAIPVNGNLNFLGDSGIATSATGDTVTISLTGGSSAIDSFIPDTGTSPVVPTGAGAVTMTGGNGVLTTGGTNSLTFDMQSPFTGDFVFTGRLTAEFFETESVTAGMTITDNSITADGTDSNISLFITPKGTGGAVVSTNLTVGNANQDVNFTVNGLPITAVVSVEAEGVSDLGGIVSHRHSDTAGFGAHTLYLRSRGTFGSETIVQSGDGLGLLSFCGYDGTDWSQAAQILVSVDGTPGANDMPGRVVFLTSSDGSQTPTEAMRISANGSVLASKGNLSVSRSSVGSEVSSSIINSDNTDAGSDAVSRISVGGDSAGSPMQVFTVAGTTNWTHGIDNGDSDKYKIAPSDGALATNTVLSIDTGGTILAPGNLEIIREASGSGVFTKITNSSDTAGSEATMNILVQGTSAHDPRTYYSIGVSATPTTSWAHGIDNSDSDNFKISSATGATAALGTNDTLIINPNGTVKVPLNDFYVERSGAGINVGAAIINTETASASSSAVCSVGVNAATAGDPFFQLVISGANVNKFGLDNSDSDSFIYNVGANSSNSGLDGNTAFKVTQTGDITLGINNGNVISLNNTTATTIGANGGASALTALPVGYILVNINGSPFEIPYYNRA